MKYWLFDRLPHDLKRIIWTAFGTYIILMSTPQDKWAEVLREADK